ncbi:hypothetical protein FB567DRAFT_213424 [Paraphoma chrysanthemicola]|uniref:Uncharacterized protein n=1 Tax=Paraphoma chrysanthemicola TaxID=798071 RepID=A0A8K0QUV3_9PLEO|nr:hypothetical protein FB567DRAFT_213424 [Paraphoma chrysanthemicola]
MTWTAAKTAGLVIGILLLVTAFAGVAIVYYRRRQNDNLAVKVADSEVGIDSPAPSSPNPALTIPTPAVTDTSTGTVRRQTGRPQTFQDWVQSSNATTLVKPSFDNGPGPTLSSGPPSVYPRAPPSNIGTSSVATRPGTRDSVGGSSLRQAVLGAINADNLEGMARDKTELVVAVPKVEKSSQPVKPRGYSGAWP